MVFIAIILLLISIIQEDSIADNELEEKLAILPFINKNQSSELEYLSYGIAMSLASGLLNMDPLSIIPMEVWKEQELQTIDGSFKEVALEKMSRGELDFTLTGEYQIENNRIAIHSDLIDLDGNIKNYHVEGDYPLQLYSIQQELVDKIKRDLIADYHFVEKIKECVNIYRSLILLIDASDSMNEEDKIIKAKESALLALDRVNMNTEVAILSYNGECENHRATFINHGFSFNKMSLRDAVINIQADGGTPLSNAIKEAVAYMENNARGLLGHIILLCDGQDDCQGITEALEFVNQSTMDLVLDAIGYGIEEDSQADVDLNEIVEAINGRYYRIEENEDLGEVFEFTVENQIYESIEEVIFLNY